MAKELIDRRLARLAARQYGVVSRRQALRAGLTPDEVRARVRSGAFESLHAGVYRFPGSPATWHQELMAATLACARSAVSGLPAAGLWELPRVARRGVELSVPRDGSKGRGIVVRRVDLPPGDVTRIGPIPVTSVARTLIDVASLVSQRQLNAMFDDAAKRKLVTIRRLERRLDTLGGRGRAGTAAIREVIAARKGVITVPQNVFESALFDILREEGLPLPVPQYPVRLGNGRRAFIDFAYPDVKLAIEADGFETHSELGDWQRDRARQNELVVLGWTVLRVTWEDLTLRPRETARMIARTLERLRANHRVERGLRGIVGLDVDRRRS